MEEGTPPPSAELRAELAALKPRALQKRAEAIGVDEDALDEAEDAAATIELIVARTKAVAAEATAASLAALRDELKLLKPRALQKRADDAGVDEDALDDAEDSEAIIALILARLAAPEPGAAAGAAEAAAKVAAEEAARLARLEEELRSLKPRALGKRAEEMGISEDQLDAAEDDAAIIALILAREAPAPAAPASRGAHGGSSADSGATPDAIHAIFVEWAKQGKHIMFSYQWDAQEEVKAAHALMQKKKIPVWMDVSGGMASDIYDSMAEGVQHAAVIVCFMSQQYEDSKNCALELKFAAQTGVPIVPVMVQSDFTASGWLGIVTAGLLWTRLWQPSTFVADVDSLVQQILRAVDEEVADDPDESSDTISEVKDELLRLREDTEVKTKAPQPAEEAWIPTLVQDLPAGLLVTPEMEELLSKVLSATSGRVGFCGMGGIGKTVISSWLVHQREVRRAFDKIAWISFGQTPNIGNMQRLLYEQLTPGSTWTYADAAEDVKTQRLGEAFRGQNILLVCDDVWDPEHEKQVNFVDKETGSKVLVSSRIHATLAAGGADSSTDDSSWIVQIQLPTEDQAVSMLLSTAGVSADQAAPPEALELVKFCNMLPLAISIAGQLVKDLELDASSDWDGIVALMKEEYADGSKRSVEDTVILTSLKSITGTHKENITMLFKCLALCPEDTIVPLSSLAMLFEAGASTDAKPVKRPSILMIRRWLKVLIDRSLVLGTVDRMSLHDIVGEFTKSMHTEEELQQAHRRVVELLRQSRPQSPECVPAWSVGASIGQDEDQMLRYVDEAALHHVTLGWKTASGDDLESDNGAISGWLGDCPQDILTHAAATVLGPERLEKLVEAAEAADDQWSLARRAVLAAELASAAGDMPAKLGWWRRALDALGKLGAGSATPERRMQELLELRVFCVLSAVNDPEDSKYCARAEYLLQLDHVESSPISKGLCKQFFNTQGLFVNPAGYGQDFFEYLRIMAHGARTHPDPRMQKMCMMLLAISGMNHPSFEADGWDWDEIYLSSDGKTSFSKQVAEVYDFSSCHKWSIKECYGADWIICNAIVPAIMAYHYGELHESIQHYERTMPLVDEVLVQPNQAEEAITILCTGFGWAHFALDMKRPEVYLRAMEKLQFTWTEIDATIAQHHPHYALPGSAACFSLLIKSSYVMCGGDMHGVSVDQIVAILPTWEEHIEIAKSGLPFSFWDQLGPNDLCLGLVIASLYEHLGRVDDALEWSTKKVAAGKDVPNGGSTSIIARLRALSIQGRCLAAKGQLAEAEEALSQAVKQFGDVGWYLSEVLTLRDLLLCVLKKTDREAEGMARLKAAVVRLVGADAPKEQLDVLATSLGDEVDLAALLAC